MFFCKQEDGQKNIENINFTGIFFRYLFYSATAYSCERNDRTIERGLMRRSFALTISHYQTATI